MIPRRTLPRVTLARRGRLCSHESNSPCRSRIARRRISCSDATGPGHQPSDLEAARQLWRAQNLHTYAFTVQRSCFCANVHPLYVFVLSDTVAGVLDLQTGEAVDRQLGETVEDLFTFVQNAIDGHAH